MKPIYVFPIVIVACVLVGVTAFSMLMDKEAKATQTTKVVATDSPKPVIDVQDRLSAVFRGHPNSDKVCYDANYDGFFLHYKDVPLDESVPTDRYFGWYMVQDIVFYQAANNTWFIGDQPTNKYFKSYPVVTGLPCKEIHD